MENKNLNKLGIDIGSTTVKIAVLGKNNELLFADYERHFANIRETLTDLLKKAFDKLGNLKLAPMITGSGCAGGYFRIYCLTELCATD